MSSSDFQFCGMRKLWS